MKPIQTGMAVAYLRATGNLLPKNQRINDDPFSAKMLPGLYKFLIWLQRKPKTNEAMIRLSEKKAPGSTAWFLCRFRYIDDVLKKCINQKEITSVVNLGAGWDCRAYFIPGAEKMKYFEIDYPQIIKKKKAKIKKILGKLPDHVVYIPIDFNTQNLEAELKNAGYDLKEKTLFIQEAVSQYITKEANESTWDYIARAASGSKLVFTYVIKSFLEGKNIHQGIKFLYDYMVNNKSPLFINGLEPSEMDNYLSKHGLSLIEDVDSKGMEERYMKQVDLELDMFEIERMVLAEIK